MSIRIQSEVWEHSQHKGGTLLVLLALADNADNDTHLAWPSVADLARRSRMCRRQVQTILRKLESSGEIRTVQGGGYVDGKRKATVYRVFHPDDRKGEKTAPLEGEKTSPSLPTGRSGLQGMGEVFDMERVKWGSPQPSIESPIQPSLSKHDEKKWTLGWNLSRD